MVTMRMTLRTLRIWSVLFVWGLCIAAQAAPGFLLAGGRDSATVPFELIGSHIYVHALVNGRGPYYFALDSGATDLVTPETARALGLTPEERMVKSPGGHEYKVKTLPLAFVQVGDVTLRDQRFAVVPFDSYGKVEGVTPFGGLLGYELLKAFIVRIDYEKQMLTFTTPEKFQPPSSAARLPLTFLAHIPQVTARVDGLEGRFDIDTGDRRSVALFRAFVAKNGLRAKYPPKARAMTGWGVRGPVWSDLSRAGAFEIGGFVIARPLVEMDLPRGGAFDFRGTAGNIGSGLLRQFTVTFDYSRHQMFLERNAQFGQPIIFDRSGLWLNQEEARFAVVDVVTDSPAAQVGVQVGDAVTAVNGRPFAALSLPVVRDMLRQSPPGTRVRMTVQSKSGGPPRDVTITLRDLV